MNLKHTDDELGQSLISYLVGMISAFENELRNPQFGATWNSRSIEYDFESVIEKLEAIQAPLSYSWGVVNHLMGVKDSADLRTSHETMQPAVVEVYQSLGQSQPLFQALGALKKRQSVWKDLDEAQQRIVSASIRSMVHSGVGEYRKYFSELLAVTES